MILQSLNKLYDRLIKDPDYGVPEPGYSIQKIAFKVVLSPQGDLVRIVDDRIEDDGKFRPRQLPVPGQAKPPGSGINPCFLWDNTGYMLGYKPDDPKPERTRETFEAFRDRHLQHLGDIDTQSYAAVCAFLKSWDPDQAAETFLELSPDALVGFGVFQIIGNVGYVHEEPAVRDWWKQHCGATEDQPVLGQCLLTGLRAPVARLQPKIKGVAGGRSEAPLVAFNESAYESYGKSQSFNAPVSQEAAEQYGAALNALLDGPMQDKHRFQLGDTTVAFWTERPTPTEDVLVDFCTGGAGFSEESDVQDETLRKRMELFLSALRQGRERYQDLDENPEQTSFYMLGLSPNVARLSVRFFYKASLDELLDNLRQHLHDIGTRPQPAAGKRRADPEFPPLWLLLAQTAREKKEIPPLLAGPLLRAVIAGTAYPAGLFTAVMRRIHVDRHVNYARVCVMKGYLVRNLNKEVPMSLDISIQDPAYRLGRLFAALEKTQMDSQPNINATIRDRFYSAASATPGSVFPRLLRTYTHHLANLGKTSPGQKVNREKLVQEILDPIAEFPTHLTLHEQGQFAIGYYHQMQNFYRRKDNKENSSTQEKPEE